MKLKELTPAHMICHTNNCCPAVFETETGSLMLIGKKVNALEAGIADRVADDEFVIEISKELLANVK